MDMVDKIAKATREAVAKDRGRSVPFVEMSYIVALAALGAMSESLVADMETLKYTPDQGIDNEMQAFNDGCDKAIAVIQKATAAIEEHQQ